MAGNNRKLLYHKSAPSVVIVSSNDQHNLVAHSLKKRNILQAVHVEYVSQIFDGSANWSIQPQATRKIGCTDFPTLPHSICNITPLLIHHFFGRDIACYAMKSNCQQQKQYYLYKFCHIHLQI